MCLWKSTKQMVGMVGEDIQYTVLGHKMDILWVRKITICLRKGYIAAIVHCDPMVEF